MHLLANAYFIADLVTLRQLPCFLTFPILLIDLLLERFPHGRLLSLALILHDGGLVATLR